MSNIQIDNTTFDQKIPIGVILQSFLVGFFMDIKCITYILSSYGFDENSSIMTLLYVATIAGIIAIGFFNKTYKNPEPIAYFILAYIAFSYFATVTFGGDPLVTLPHLAVFTISAFVIPFISQIDARITLRAIMLYPVLGINRLSEIFVFVAEWNEWISMGLSYAFYVPIVATIIYLSIYFRYENKLNKIITIILSLVNFVYLFELFQFGSRGPIMLLLLLIGFLFVVRPSDCYGIVIKKASLAIGIILGVLIILFFDQILFAMDAILSSYGISSHVVTKFIHLSAAGDISHDRNNIGLLAINGFLDSPVWGNGFDCFNQNTGMMYPHNFILQLLYDGGLFLLFILVLPAIRRIRQSLQICTLPYYGIFVFLVFGGVAGGLFSGDIWKLPLLWLFIGFTLSNSFIYNYE